MVINEGLGVLILDRGDWLSPENGPGEDEFIENFYAGVHDGSGDSRGFNWKGLGYGGGLYIGKGGNLI